MNLKERMSALKSLPTEAEQFAREVVCTIRDLPKEVHFSDHFNEKNEADSKTLGDMCDLCRLMRDAQRLSGRD